MWDVDSPGGVGGELGQYRSELPDHVLLRALAVVVVACVIPALLSIAAHQWFGELRYVHEVLHQSLELVGSCIALGVSMLLLLRIGHERGQTHLLWAAAALIAMGLIDAIHASAPFGVGWSWLRHISTLAGGIAFGLIWVPLPEMTERAKGLIVVVVVLLAGAAVTMVMAWPQSLPAPWGIRGYTLPVKVANGLGALGFAASAAYFLRRYARSWRRENLVYAAQTLLFATSGALFWFSELWNANWWLWHGLRLTAYVVVLVASYETIARLYEQMQGQARFLEARVQERAAALQRSEEQFRLASQATNEAIWDWDLTTNRREWNGAVLAQFGETADKFGHSAEAWVARLHPDDRDRIVQSLDQAIAGRDSYWTGEYRLQRKDGTYGVFVDRGMIARDAQGKAYRIVGSMADVTHERQAQEAQEAARDMLSGIIEGTTDLVAAVDTGYRFIAFNRPFHDSYVRIFGVDIQLGMNLIDVLSHVPQDQKKAIELWSRALDGEVFVAEAEFGDPARARQAFDLSFGPIGDRHGRLVGAAQISRDVTEYKRMEEALRESRRQAEHANRAKDHFLAVLSHELRTPLTPVLTTLGLMQRDLPESLRDDVETIRRNVEMEARLIDDLLDVTRIVRGKVELDRQQVDLCQVVRRAAEVCRPDIQAKGLRFALEIEPGGPYFVNADPARLQQVFWNLIKNAIKFTPPTGQISVRTRHDDGHAIVEVADSGQGIEPEVLPRIFNAFEQGGADITRQFGGLGLGLSISKGLVEMHGGSVEAFSEGKGRGATFRIRLPLIQQAATPGTPQGARPGVLVRPLRILLVDDHADTARTMVRLLARQGHHAQSAGDMASALKCDETGEFDLLISDLGLPDGSGADLLREIRRRGRRYPAIALSGYGQEQDLRTTADAGFAAHLVKPVSPERLTETIAHVTAS